MLLVDDGDYQETRGGEAFLRGRKKKQGKEEGMVYGRRSSYALYKANEFRNQIK